MESTRLLSILSVLRALCWAARTPIYAYLIFANPQRTLPPSVRRILLPELADSVRSLSCHFAITADVIVLSTFILRVRPLIMVELLQEESVPSCQDSTLQEWIGARGASSQRRTAAITYTRSMQTTRLTPKVTSVHVHNTTFPYSKSLIAAQ